MRTRRERLVVENIGDAAAEDVSVTIVPVGDGQAPTVWSDSPAERVPPRSSVTVPLAVHGGVAAQWRVTLRWFEDGTQFEEVQSLTPF